MLDIQNIVLTSLILISFITEVIWKSHNVEDAEEFPFSVSVCLCFAWYPISMEDDQHQDENLPLHAGDWHWLFLWAGIYGLPASDIAIF